MFPPNYPHKDFTAVSDKGNFPLLFPTPWLFFPFHCDKGISEQCTTSWGMERPGNLQQAQRETGITPKSQHDRIALGKLSWQTKGKMSHLPLSDLPPAPRPLNPAAAPVLSPLSPPSPATGTARPSWTCPCPLRPPPPSPFRRDAAPDILPAPNAAPGMVCMQRRAKVRPELSPSLDPPIPDKGKEQYLVLGKRLQDLFEDVNWGFGICAAETSL